MLLLLQGRLREKYASIKERIGALGKLVEPICEKFVRELGTLSENHAMPVVEHMAEYLSRMLENNDRAVLECKYVDAVLGVFSNVVSNVADPTANKQIILFFEYLIGSTSELYRTKIDAWLALIASSAVQAIPTCINATTDVALLLIGVLGRSEEIAKAAIEAALAQPKFQTVPANVRSVFFRYVARFKTCTPKIRAIVLELNKLLNSASTPDAFIGFELQLSQVQKTGQVHSQK